MAMVMGLVLVAITGWSQGRVAVFSVGLDMVKVTVSVEDKAGRNVRDLTADDFQIKEDGRPQQIKLFARAYDPGENDALTLDLAILFDTSQSMIDVLKLSQQAAVRFLDAIPRARDLLVVFFDQDIRISRYDSEHQQGLFAQIMDSEGGGNTALRDAIATSLSRIQAGQGRSAMVIFTDGEDSFSRISVGELMAAVESSPVTIYPVAFEGAPINKDSAARARAFLDHLAKTTGGRVFHPRSARELPEVYQTILEDLEGQYVLGYIPDNPRQDRGFRKLKIKVHRKGVKVRHRVGYLPPRS